MQAVVLAAGRGSRLCDLTDARPKCMLPLAGRPLLHHIIRALRACGADPISVVTGYQGHVVDAPTTRTIHNERWHETGIAWSLACARAALDKSEDAVVSYGDIVYEPRVLQTLVAADKPGVSIPVNTQWYDLWTMRMADPLADAERLIVNAHGHITTIGGRARSEDEIQAQYMGIVRLRGPTGQQLLRWYTDAVARHAESDAPQHSSPEAWDLTTLLSHWIGAGGVVHGVPVRGGWLEIDTEDDYALYKKLWSDGNLARFCRLEE